MRCGCESLASIMSMFNTDEICMACKAKERQHPDYRRAADRELAEVKAGNYNYPGVGKPTDL
jgi:hypothetical protein